MVDMDLEFTPQDGLPIPFRVHECMLTEARAAFPREACGLLLGEPGRITHALPARNVHVRPETHFEIDPQALIDAHRAARGGGPQVLGYYHTHPSGPPRPSAEDIRMAAGDGRIWAIVGENRVELWEDVAGGFRAISYSLVNG